MEKKLNERCTCTAKCPLHGNCLECITKHMDEKIAVHCMRNK
ncbi:MAG: hypothetical protein WCQ76_05190 [Fusobacterium sp.]